VSGRRRLQLAGLAITCAGLVAVATGGADLGYGLWRQQQVTEQWQREVGGPPAAVGARASPAPPVPRAGSGGAAGGASGAAGQAAGTAAGGRPAGTRSSAAVFALWIPSLGYYAAVRQGVDAGVLAGGPGHYPTTAWPGQPGIVGVAAHNTFWIAFDRLKAGAEIVLQTRTGSYGYRITGTRIVSADDRSLFPASDRHLLTLTTCWPLWAGALAPRRLAILATQTTPAGADS
jgi:LPXTG-site transpeptidase (sortase) family protein